MNHTSMRKVAINAAMIKIDGFNQRGRYNMIVCKFNEVEFN